MVAVHATVLLLHPHRVAVRTTSIIEPRSFVESGGLSEKREVIHPAAYGVAPPPRFVDLFRKLPAIGPNRAPFLVEFIQNDNILGRLDDSARS